MKVRFSYLLAAIVAGGLLLEGAVSDAAYICAATGAAANSDGGRLLSGRLSSYEIKGHLAAKGSPLHLPSIHSCFGGIGFAKCMHIPKSWKDTAPDSVNTPFHFNASFEYGEKYCLECCSNSRESYTFDETWRFYCDVRSEAVVEGINVHELNSGEAPAYEFRFARQRTITDDCVTTCDLKWSEAPNLGRDSLRPIVAGYTLTVDVREYAQGFSYWRGVEACEATLLERKRYKPTDKVKDMWEAITIANSPGSRSSPFSIIITAISLAFALAPLL